MPLKIKKKGGGYKLRSFGQLVGDYKRQGMSEDKARRIVGSIEKQQYPKKKKKFHR